MARAFAKREAERLLTLRDENPEACPACRRQPRGALRRAIAAGLREALFPDCGPCATGPSAAAPAAAPATAPATAPAPRRPGPIHTRGSVGERVAGVAIAKDDGGGGSQHADPTRSSFTVWELRKDGPRNECDYRVYLDERYRAQPLVMEKVPCVSNNSEMRILGRPYLVHLPDAPRYSPNVG